MAGPLHIAAIDAGSNALRLVVARAESPWEIRRLATERYPLRLGHRAFTERRFDEATLRKAVKAFRHFRRVMDEHGVEKYRAVATAASREARNRRVLLERVQRRSGIRLEVIDGAEEARLVRTGVLAAVGDKLSPRVIVDLGGGSTQISVLRQGTLESTVALPIGTVRLMEAMKIRGAITPSQVEEVRDYVLSFLRTLVPRRGDPAVPAVACGGNAEALAQIAAGPAEFGFDSLSLRLLRDRMWDMVQRSVPSRMKAYGVRQDRAEVMGIAAVVLTTLGQWLGVRNLIVPGVGVREGVLRELVVAHFAALPRDVVAREAQDLLAAARAFGRRAEYDSRHAEQVRRMALGLYDQLGPVHRQGSDARLALELAAVLHDVGYFISADAHHKHSEYLIRHGDIGTLNGDMRARVGCIARYHSKAVPEPHHKSYSLLDEEHQRQVRGMAALLRIAEALDSTHRQDVSDVQAEVRGKQVRLDVAMRTPAPALLSEARQKARFFEKEFKRKVRIRRVKGKK
jgi:exopolyphosphatase/guanosine-5'-triphosphate,3'-diphosphate pyrophosphatase